MPRVKTTEPKPSRNKGERSIDLPYYLTRIPYMRWARPSPFQADMWRRVVKAQPFALICRDTLIDNNLSLDWKIEPRDSSMREELSKEIGYYTKFFEYTGEYDYMELVEWAIKDILDIPFGTACELGRESDDPNGRLLWIKPLDGGTLFPTNNRYWPVGQTVPDANLKTVYFPEHAIDRIYYSPRTVIQEAGWGEAPPEKVFLALELLSRGDTYYASLLLDTPEAGILDLGDMAADSAEAWVEAWREMLNGIDPFKIPVIYEHQKDIKWIPFTRNPSDILYDSAIARYGAILAAGYGLTLGDLGLPMSSSGGDTLAGSIRGERKSRKTGQAKIKKKMLSFFNKMLPHNMKFSYIDLDDEFSVALGRARLSTTTALGAAVANRAISPKEYRHQLIADGLMSIPMSEDVDESEFDILLGKEGMTPERPSLLGRPVAPSEGGQGEIRNSFVSHITIITNVSRGYLHRMIYAAYPSVFAEVWGSLESLDTELQTAEWTGRHSEALWEHEGGHPYPDLIVQSINSAKQNIKSALRSEEWWKMGDTTLAIDDTKQIVIDTYIDAFKREAKALYVKGEIKSPDIEPDVEILDIERIDNGAKTYILNVLSELPENLSRAVISGVRAFLIHYPDSSADEIVLSGVCLETVRNEIGFVCDMIIEDYIKEISDIIKENIPEL